jgi:hypothetical protein
VGVGGSGYRSRSFHSSVAAWAIFSVCMLVCASISNVHRSMGTAQTSINTDPCNRYCRLFHDSLLSPVSLRS